MAKLKIYDLTGRIVKDVRNIVWQEGIPVQVSYNDKQGIFLVEVISGSIRYLGKVFLY